MYRILSRLTFVLVMAVGLLLSVPGMGAVFGASGGDQLLGTWERFGDGAAGTTVEVTQANGVYQGTLKSVQGTLVDLGFVVGDHKWKDLTSQYDMSFSGTDLYRVQGGESSYYPAVFTLGVDGVLRVQVSAPSDSVIGLVQTWKKVSSPATTSVAQSSVPTNLAATGSGAAVGLNWSGVSGATDGYNLYRGTFSGGEGRIPVSDFPIQGTQYTDANVDAGSTYYYVCRAVYADGTESSNSNEAVVTIGGSSGTTVTMGANGKIVLWIGNPNMSVNGISKEIDPGRGTSPMIINGRTVLPIRSLIETLGGTIVWSAPDQKVTIQLNGKTIELWIGNKTTKVNGDAKTTDVAPQIINGRTMIPLRYVVDNLGYAVVWDGPSKSVTITASTTSNATPAVPAVPVTPVVPVAPQSTYDYNAALAQWIIDYTASTNYSKRDPSWLQDHVYTIEFTVAPHLVMDGSSPGIYGAHQIWDAWSFYDGDQVGRTGKSTVNSYAQDSPTGGIYITLDALKAKYPQFGK